MSWNTTAWITNMSHYIKVKYTAFCQLGRGEGAWLNLLALCMQSHTRFVLLHQIIKKITWNSNVCKSQSIKEIVVVSFVISFTGCLLMVNTCYRKESYSLLLIVCWWSKGLQTFKKEKGTFTAHLEMNQWYCFIHNLKMVIFLSSCIYRPQNANELQI